MWFFDDGYLKFVRRVGENWRTKGVQPREVHRLWTVLRSEKGREVSDCSPGARRLWDTALKLMSIADEASKGIGFVEEKGELPFSDYFLFQHFLCVFYGKHTLPNLPYSLCMMVPATEVCVQPKTKTPQIGFTLRSLSHHLALLPSEGEVKTIWMVASEKPTEGPLNLLIVPFPYRIEGGCFEGDGVSIPRVNTPSRFFTVRQNWLRKGKHKITPSEVSTFIIDLIKRAEPEVHKVHGVILPEGALDETIAPRVAMRLAATTELEVFISGTLSTHTPFGKFQRNKIYSSIFSEISSKEVIIPWEQSKHHRWKLDRDQIRRYHLGHVLNPEITWWEKIDVSNRQCHFYVFRHGATLATLICEDLARIDPVQTVLRSVGPNLVVALLMDGPQLERRWPGRYATVLADDPGSAVLTLTSIGMVRRSVMPGEEEPREIALWKDSSGIAQELKLPKGSHALLLTVSSSWEENFTLDGRSDEKSTLRLALSGVRDIVHPRPPQWVD